MRKSCRLDRVRGKPLKTYYRGGNVAIARFGGGHAIIRYETSDKICIVSLGLNVPELRQLHKLLHDMEAGRQAQPSSGRRWLR
jgi:hypothetical protein